MQQIKIIRALGLASWLRLRGQMLRLKISPNPLLLALTSKKLRHPVWFRPKTSDIFAFQQVLIDLEYDCFSHLKSAAFILDCGANVGYTSAFFLSQFPSCSVIAIEPDPDNFNLLEKNLKPYGARARAVHAGVWSHSAHLKMATQTFRSGDAMSRQVVECSSDDPESMPAIGIRDLITQSHHPRISILKMDIEGAEAVVLSTNTEQWMDAVDHMAVEIHPDSHFGDAQAAFDKAVSKQRFQIGSSGELTVATRITATDS